MFDAGKDHSPPTASRSSRWVRLGSLTLLTVSYVRSADAGVKSLISKQCKEKNNNDEKPVLEL